MQDPCRVAATAPRQHQLTPTPKSFLHTAQDETQHATGRAQPSSQDCRQIGAARAFSLCRTGLDHARTSWSSFAVISDFYDSSTMAFLQTPILAISAQPVFALKFKRCISENVTPLPWGGQTWSRFEQFCWIFQKRMRMISKLLLLSKLFKTIVEYAAKYSLWINLVVEQKCVLHGVKLVRSCRMIRDS